MTSVGINHLIFNPSTIKFAKAPLPSLKIPAFYLNPKLRSNDDFPSLSSSTFRTSRSIVPTVKASDVDIDMVRTSDGTWSAKTEEKVVVLWDLDNKPPSGPPYEAAMSLRNFASLFGTVVDVSAYANRHAFIHVPRWVLDQRRERRDLDILERRRVSVPSEPYLCGVCGRKCKTHMELKKHFKQLHERERNKKVSRMRSLKGKKRQRYKERFVSGNTKYEDAARELITPRAGYGLAKELRRAGVYVRTVEDKPQAADAALKRQMQHSMSSGVDWLFLVSDDSDFTDMMWRARESNMRTVVIGDWRNALGRQAEIWVPWSGVQSGEVSQEFMKSGDRWKSSGGLGMDGLFSVAEDDDSYEGMRRDVVDSVVDKILIKDYQFGSTATVKRISQFSEDDTFSVGGGSLDDDDFRLYGSTLPGDDLFWDSEDEEDDDLGFS